MIAVTGATGALGRLVIAGLSAKLPPDRIAALARDPQKAAQLIAGIDARHADYDRPETLPPALAGVETLLLISSSEVGRRTAQHKAAIDAAKEAGVRRIVYTSVLHADRSKLQLAEEHRQTEAMIVASGIRYVLLRNGWYTENYTASIPPALQHGVMLGSAVDGRISSAARADYAAAAVEVLTGSDRATSIYELAGDDAYTLSAFAAELSHQTGKDIPYRDLPEAEYRAVLEAAGLPPPFAALLAQSDAAAADGALFDDSRALSRLIGRPTTPLRDVIAAALRG
jgi:NAD(P)H dehydrogenase (quinone)